MPKKPKRLIANGAVFRNAKGKRSLEEIAKRASVSPGTYAKLLESKEVLVETLRCAAKELNLAFEDCVLPNTSVGLPDAADFYLALRHSYYVDQDSGVHSGSPPWKEE